MAVYGGRASCLERGGQELQELSHLSEFHALCPGLWLYTDDGLLVWREEGRNFRNCLTLVRFMLCVQMFMPVAVYGGRASCLSCLEGGGLELQELSQLREFHALCPGLWQYTEDGLLVWGEEDGNLRMCMASLGRRDGGLLTLAMCEPRQEDQRSVTLTECTGI